MWTNRNTLCTFSPEAVVASSRTSSTASSQSQRNADELCERINGYQQLVIDCNTLRKELESAKRRIKKLKEKVAEVCHD